MKRINWQSLILGILITLAVVAACTHLRQPAQPAQPAQPKTTPTISNAATAEKSPKAANGIGSIDVNQLPPEARDVLKRIKTHGTFAYKQDAQPFQNRERTLPIQPRGYYQEYTVVTPNANTRGARRIIAGRGNTGDFASGGEYYYTADHYRSFYRIKE